MSISRQALDRMREAIGGDKEVFADILQSFVDEAGPLAEVLLSTGRNGELAALGRAAHTLKSSARDFGDDALAALCADVEARSKEGLLPNAAACCELMAQRCMALKEELAAYIDAELKAEIS